MPRFSERPPEAAAICVLIRMTWAAPFAADLVLRSAETERAKYCMTLTDTGVDAPSVGDWQEVARG